MKTNKLLVCLWEISHGNIDNIKPLKILGQIKQN